MKRIILLLIFLMMPATLLAQTPAAATPPQISEMKKLDFLVGQWKGAGWIEFGPGQRRTFTETENVESKLGGVVLLIEGLGKGKTGASQEEVTIHNAFAFASFDKDAKIFRWRAYRADGSSIDTEAKVSENALVWGFHDPRAGEMRFTIKLNEKKQWFEIGEFSRDGQTWQKFFEMTLDRVK
jgi:hypothetical protein